MKSKIPLVMSSAPQVPGNSSPELPGATFAAREAVARRINEVMSRFSLILEILEEISKEMVPLAGDSDIRHGCERALTSMLSRVASLDSASPSGAPAGPEEVRAKSWLDGERPARLIDPDRLHGFWSLIHSRLPVEGEQVRAS